MATIDSYIKRLEKLQHLLSINLEMSRRNGALVLCGVEFLPIRKLNFYTGELKGKGILIRELSDEEAKYCDANRISYFSGKDRLKIFKDAVAISIDTNRKFAVRKKHSIREFGRLPPPTLIISPNGFKIMDALFTQPGEQLKEYRSGLAFANQFHLNQPKLSKIMRTLKTRSIFDLRNAIADLPGEWWKLALSDKSTSKGLTKFFHVATPYYSLLNTDTREISAQLSEDETFISLSPGPLDFARGYGYLREEDISVWGTKEAFHRLKAKYRLIPGVDKEKPIWHLAIPKYGLEAEAIVSNMSPYPRDPKRGLIPTRSNVFRAVWDLGFGTERLREIQLSILKEVMSEI